MLLPYHCLCSQLVRGFAPAISRFFVVFGSFDLFLQSFFFFLRFNVRVLDEVNVGKVVSNHVSAARVQKNGVGYEGDKDARM